MIDLVSRIKEFDQVVVEASGVADIANLAQYGYAPGLQLDGVLVIADAESVVTKANDKYVASTVRRQLQAADLIILNKTDLITEAGYSTRLAANYNQALSEICLLYTSDAADE